MGKLIDLTGKKFGKLTVIERDFNYPDHKRAYWKCQCDCGNIITTRGESLRTGHTVSCGCIKEDNKIKHQQEKKEKEKIILSKKKSKKKVYTDYTGQKFGRLLVLGRNQECGDKKHIYWNCLCDCGNICIKRSDTFKTVLVPSCGCYKKEHTREQWAAKLEGQHFGKLLVIKKIEHDGLGSLWECKCDCGNICCYPSRYLLSMGIKSCGCETRSNGELELRQLLQQKNINFKEQYTCSDCVSPKGNRLKFDFAIFDKENNLQGIIEFNGEQHYNPINYFGGEERFTQIQEYDMIKRRYCFSHHIPLLEIPYTELGHINIDDYLQNIIDVNRDWMEEV